MILDGKKIAAEISSEIAAKIAHVKEKPTLALVLVGSHAPSEIYVKAKKKACEKVGILSRVLEFPETIAESDLMRQIEDLNRDPHVTGILVQLPLPKHLSHIPMAIDPAKDVDGFHPINAGKLLLGLDCFVPCTPLGIQELLKRSAIETKGKHVAILGRSNIVGKPLAALLCQKKPHADATVTLLHSHSDLSPVKSADIVVAAMGKPRLLQAHMIKEGAVVIDVGITRTSSGLVGDVDFDAVAKKASFITPVPGGVGPMTIAMLLSNTVKNY